MTKRTSVFIAGRHLANARAALGYSQGEFVALYLSAYNRLSEPEQRTARKLDGSALSRMENSTIGDLYSKVKIRTVELLAQLLNVEPHALYQAAPAPLSQSGSVLVVPVPSPEKINNTLPAPSANSIRFIGGDTELDAVDLPYIPTALRQDFARAGAQLTSLSTINLRRIYRRGTPLSMFSDRAIFEVDGDSMGPYLNSGDEVVACRVEESHWHKLINCIVVVATEATITIKKLVENDLSTRGTLTLLPYRPELASMTLNRNEIRAIYRVEQIMPRSFEAII